MRIIDRFVSWWLLRQWKFDDDVLSEHEKDRIMAEISAVEGAEKLLRVKIRKEIKRIALHGKDDRELWLGRGRVSELQSLALSMRKAAERFDLKSFSSEEKRFDEA